MCVYVDDCAIFGDAQVVRVTESGIGEHLIVVCEDLKTYVGCTYLENEKGLLVHQPFIIKKLGKQFGDMVEKNRVFETPGSPGYVETKPLDGEKLDHQEQQLFQRGVRLLMYLMKHSRPDISNRTHEVSKGMKEATEKHMKEMIRVAKFVLDTRSVMLKIYPKRVENLWEVKGL